MDKAHTYIKEDGKTFWVQPNGELVRSHDDNFTGPRFRHRRCPFCNRITSIHVLHWFNHMTACAPSQYDDSDLNELRYRPLNEVIETSYNLNKPIK